MRNPYEVLELNEGASKEEIKTAYKKLVRKYHPDQYSNNPLSDLAEEKLKEINEAYDFLMKNKNGDYKRHTGNSQTNSRYNSNESDIFIRIRKLIETGYISQAEQLLDSIGNQNAEWYFLKGVILLRKGWHDQAFQHINKAVQMNPTNPEYRSVLQNITYRTKTYRDFGYDRGYRRDPSACQICQCLICTDCCCECMGDDLITCC